MRHHPISRGWPTLMLMLCIALGVMSWVLLVHEWHDPPGVLVPPLIVGSLGFVAGIAAIVGCWRRLHRQPDRQALGG